MFISLGMMVLLLYIVCLYYITTRTITIEWERNITGQFICYIEN
jgi:hypothetical protein